MKHPQNITEFLMLVLHIEKNTREKLDSLCGAFHFIWILAHCRQAFLCSSVKMGDFSGTILRIPVLCTFLLNSLNSRFCFPAMTLFDIVPKLLFHFRYQFVAYKILFSCFYSYKNPFLCFEPVKVALLLKTFYPPAYEMLDLG